MNGNSMNKMNNNNKINIELDNLTNSFNELYKKSQYIANKDERNKIIDKLLKIISILKEM